MSWEDELENCVICDDDPCTCFKGTRICEYCGKEYNKYNRIHTCRKPKESSD